MMKSRTVEVLFLCERGLIALTRTTRVLGAVRLTRSLRPRPLLATAEAAQAP
jgi:hypothetical protein